MPSSHDLARDLVRFTTDQLDAFAAHHGPELRLPRVFGGHLVGCDARADLAYTLGFLADAGVDEVAGRPLPDVVADALGSLEGWATDTFASYRVAEVLGRWGPFAINTLIADWDEAARAEVAAACDSSYWLGLLDSGAVPQNYKAVLARCESARRQLGLLDRGEESGPEHDVLDDLVGRTVELLTRRRPGELDDSTHGVGRYDIYSVDVWLFTEALAHAFPDRLGPLWHTGTDHALTLVDRVGSPAGPAIVWGRSTGVLSLALAIEVSAVAGLVAGDDPDRRGRLLARARVALEALGGWFGDGVITAHLHRSTYDYRGPFRRLQLTFDILGKLAYSASALLDQPEVEVPAATPRSGRSLLRFESGPGEPEAGARQPGIWVADAATAPLLVPFVGTTRSDYLPAPREPGIFEVPVDSALVTWLPLIVRGTRSYSPGGVPDTLTAEGDDAIEATWSSLPQTGAFDPGPDDPALEATARLGWRRVGRTIELTGALALPSVPRGLAITIPEAAGRPLSVVAEATVDDGNAIEDPEPPATSADLVPVPVRTVDTDGIKEWRSFWSELPTVHELDLPLGRRVRYRVRVTPRLRVSSSAFGHHYDQSLYGPLADEVAEVGPAVGGLRDRSVRLGAIDLFHAHWPEWIAFDDPAAHDDAIARLHRAGVPIVWTVHNLVPHEKRTEVYDAIYQRWIDAAAALVHHSDWARARVHDRYRVPDGVLEAVIPHGHFGDLYPGAAPAHRAEAEAALGLTHVPLRIGVVGAPRAEKDLTTFFAGLTACGRDDLEVVCWSLDADDPVPDDPRVRIAERYEMVPAEQYAQRLAVCDVLALPFGDGGDMLATGTASDAVGLGLPVLASSWGYLAEHLGDAAIPMGDDASSIAAALDALTPGALAVGAEASVTRRGAYTWERSAEATLALFERVLLARG